MLYEDSTHSVQHHSELINDDADHNTGCWHCMEVNCWWHFLLNVSKRAQLHTEPTLKSSYQQTTLLITITALHKTLNTYWLDKAPACGLVLHLKEATNPPNMQKDSPRIYEYFIFINIMNSVLRNLCLQSHDRRQFHEDVYLRATLFWIWKEYVWTWTWKWWISHKG